MKFPRTLIISIILFTLFIPFYSFSYPSWIKPGLVIVYSYEGGVGTNTGTIKGSGIYGTGYKIFLVLQVDKTGIYGDVFTMLNPQFSGTYYMVETTYLNDFKKGEFFYLDPKQTDRAILKKEAPPNCQVSGSPGTYILECNTVGNIQKNIIKYDRKSGLVTEFITMEVSFSREGRNSGTGKLNI